jgi:hypothetical protein
MYPSEGTPTKSPQLMSTTEDAATDSTEDSTTTTTTTTTTTNDLSASGELTGFTDASLEESATSLVTEEEIEAYETRVEEKAEKEKEEEEVAEAPTITTTDNTQPIFESAIGTGSLTNDVPQMSKDGPSSLSLPQDLKR